MLANRLKSLRLKANLTQEELGKKLGVQRSAINKWEKGIVTNIKRDTIIKMSEIFNESPSYIMAFDDEKEVFPIVVDKVNGVLVTTSNRVAEELGVTHRDLLEKIDGYISKFGSAETFAGFYIPSEYTHPQNKQVYRNYLITEKGIAQLIGGYSSAVPKAFYLNVAYINEFERMRKMLKETSKPSITFEQTIEMAKVIKDTPLKAMNHVFRALKVFVPELEMPEVKTIQGSKVVKDDLKFQKQLNRYLKENGLTVCSFARKNGLAKSNVWNWANGKVTPSMPNLQIIANIIGSDLNMFL